jgi:hypothetical protein
MLGEMRYSVNSGQVISEVIDGEAVMINMTTGNYYSLNETGAVIWDALERSASVEEIVGGLESSYDSTREQIEQAVGELVAELEREELIVPAAGAGQSQSARVEPGPGGGTFAQPRLEKHTDMQDLILLDPVHEVGQAGWPHKAEGEGRTAAPVTE